MWAIVFDRKLAIHSLGARCAKIRQALFYDAQKLADKAAEHCWPVGDTASQQAFIGSYGRLSGSRYGR